MPSYEGYPKGRDGIAGDPHERAVPMDKKQQGGVVVKKPNARRPRAVRVLPGN